MYIKLIEIFNIADLSVIKLLLDSENIDYNLSNELTLQTTNAFALGATGASLEVAVQQMDKAINILEKNGFYKPENEADAEGEANFRRTTAIVTTGVLLAFLGLALMWKKNQ